MIGPPRFCGEAGGVWTIEAGYSLFQTDMEGVSRLFSIGRYLIEFTVSADLARIRSVLVIADTGLIPTLLATPI